MKRANSFDVEISNAAFEDWNTVMSQTAQHSLFWSLLTFSGRRFAGSTVSSWGTPSITQNCIPVAFFSRKQLADFSSAARSKKGKKDLLDFSAYPTCPFYPKYRSVLLLCSFHFFRQHLASFNLIPPQQSANAKPRLPVRSARTLGSLVLPYVRHPTLGGRPFSMAAARSWNSIPREVRRSSETFTNALKFYLIHRENSKLETPLVSLNCFYCCSVCS